MVTELPKILNTIYKTTTFIATTDAMFSLYTRYMDTSKEEILQKDEIIKQKDKDLRQKDDDLRKKDDDLRKKADDLRQKDEIIKDLISQNHTRSSWFFWRKTNLF